jgi:TDG/mug DNA glycosylase family protein
MIYCFNPIINKDTTILILGSMPGEESLRRQEYYGLKRNQFWKIMFSIFNETYCDNYGEKVNLLVKHNIGLWDVIYSCEREGSLDSNIMNERPNDFNSLFNNYTNIKCIIFNGTKAMNSFKRHVDSSLYLNKRLLLLPSTSPAHTMPYEEKLALWKRLLECLNDR